ncbi:transporter substrate-binding domain-containing protein [Aliikangiella coralliicola]|uniref:Transporter substrate-binding domain-containing protein n=1 Tax=Aliikangiella coralliicola TaxID=2592383 RepID=A0A545UG55_9GAMM|nr:transporter substrate-binding domain-containing protein [Aliikangiella coralliicola]TQV88454.1 transporter substrate-binding domain-containing protein [Aliikangiella coralliicola]
MKLKLLNQFSLIFMILFSIDLSAATFNYMVVQKQSRPLQIEDYNQNHRGIVTDIVYAIFDGSNHRINTNTLPFDQLISDLESSRYANWITYGSPGWVSVQSDNLSDKAILKVRHNIVVNRQDDFEFKQKSDLDNKTIILLAGFDYPELEKYIKEKRLREIRVKNFNAAFKLLERLGKRACFIEMDLRIKYNQKILSIKENSFRSQSFSSVIPDYNIYLALDSNMDEKLQEFINKRLKLLANEAWLNEVIQKYQ